MQKGSRVLHLHQGDRTKALGHRVGRQGNQGYGVCFRDNDRYVKKIDIWIHCKKNHNPKLTEDLPLPSAKVSSTPLGEAVFAEYISK